MHLHAAQVAPHLLYSPFIHSFFHPSAHPSMHPFRHSASHSLTLACMQSFTRGCMHSFIRLVELLHKTPRHRKRTTLIRFKPKSLNSTAPWRIHASCCSWISWVTRLRYEIMSWKATCSMSKSLPGTRETVAFICIYKFSVTSFAQSQLVSVFFPQTFNDVADSTSCSSSWRDLSKTCLWSASCAPVLGLKWWETIAPTKFTPSGGRRYGANNFI